MINSNFTDRIKPDGISIVSYLECLRRGEYQIPTFQREIVWKKENVKRLWDSIYKFYPLGSILIWKTDIKLQNHREIGGHVIPFDDSRNRFQYILDGQQRTTSLLTSIYGGRIEGRPGFDPTLYIDLTIPFSDEVDDVSYMHRFLFWDEIDDKGGVIIRNTSKQRRYNDGLIIKLRDIRDNFHGIFTRLSSLPESASLLDHLWRIRSVLDSYRIALIDLHDITVSQVCQIFERINQAGEPLSLFDIVVAKTYRPASQSQKGFYLRELINSFRESSLNSSKFQCLSNFDYLQILGMIIRENITDSGIKNITPRYLNNIKAAQIEKVWADTRTAILKMVDFFENHLHIKTPDLVPFRYFYISLSFYFFNNRNPDYDFLKRYFWFYSFHNEDLLRNTTHLFQHIAFLMQRNSKNEGFGRFLIDKDRLRRSSYNSKGRLSRAILSLFSNQLPRDWKYTDRIVVTDNLFFTTDKPNLHHIFPSHFIEKNPGLNSLNSNSLMNIVYLTQITNLEISDRNPLKYIKDYDKEGFDDVLKSHLLSSKLLEWSRMDTMPDNALDEFIEDRTNSVLDQIKAKLSGIEIEVIDTKGTAKKEVLTEDGDSFANISDMNDI